MFDVCVVILDYRAAGVVTLETGLHKQVCPAVRVSSTCSLPVSSSGTCPTVSSQVWGYFSSAVSLFFSYSWNSSSLLPRNCPTRSPKKKSPDPTTLVTADLSHRCPYSPNRSCPLQQEISVFPCPKVLVALLQELVDSSWTILFVVLAEERLSVIRTTIVSS